MKFQSFCLGAFSELFVYTGPVFGFLELKKYDGGIYLKHIIKSKVVTINKDMKDMVNFWKLTKSLIERFSENNGGHNLSLYKDIESHDGRVKATEWNTIEKRRRFLQNYLISRLRI